MSTSNIEERYAQAAEARGAAMDDGDHRKANKAYEELAHVVEQLRLLPDRGLLTLSHLLDHPAPHVRCWAATHLLPVDEEAATRVLRQLSGLPPFVGFNAAMVLREWAAGRLKVP